MSQLKFNLQGSAVASAITAFFGGDAEKAMRPIVVDTAPSVSAMDPWVHGPLSMETLWGSLPGVSARVEDAIVAIIQDVSKNLMYGEVSVPLGEQPVPGGAMTQAAMMYSGRRSGSLEVGVAFTYYTVLRYAHVLQGVGNALIVMPNDSYVRGVMRTFESAPFRAWDGQDVSGGVLITVSQLEDVYANVDPHFLARFGVVLYDNIYGAGWSKIGRAGATRSDTYALFSDVVGCSQTMRGKTVGYPKLKRWGADRYQYSVCIPRHHDETSYSVVLNAVQAAGLIAFDALDVLNVVEIDDIGNSSVNDLRVTTVRFDANKSTCALMLPRGIINAYNEVGDSLSS